MAAYGGPLMELIRLPSVHRIFLRASVYEASPGARFARATGRRIKYDEFSFDGKTSAVSTRLCNLLRFFFSWKKSFLMKILICFIIIAQNINCGYTLEPPHGSNEYPQFMFQRKNKKKMYTPVHPGFTYKNEVRGV